MQIKRIVIGPLLVAVVALGAALAPTAWASELYLTNGFLFSCYLVDLKAGVQESGFYKDSGCHTLLSPADGEYELAKPVLKIEGHLWCALVNTLHQGTTLWLNDKCTEDSPTKKGNYLKINLVCAKQLLAQGSSLQKLLQQNVWLPDTGCLITYDPTGSGAGRLAWGAETGNNHPLGGTGESPRESGDVFVASDEPLGKTQLENLDLAAGGKFGKAGEEQALVIPVAQAAVAVIVNPPSECLISQITNENLKLVWSGNISEWSQISGVTEDKSGACKKMINRVVRKDVSGTTFVFKTYLEETAKGEAPCTGGKKWSEYAAPAENLNWPECKGLAVFHALINGGGGEVEEVINETDVTGKEGTIGYANLGDARAKYTGTNNYKWLKVQNQKENNTTFEFPGTSAGEPSATAGEANCEETKYTGTKPAVGPDDDWSSINGAHTKENVHYPICTLTYDVALVNYELAEFKEAFEEAKEAREYLTWVASKEGGQEALKGHDFRQVEEAVGSFAEEEAHLVESANLVG